MKMPRVTYYLVIPLILTMLVVPVAHAHFGLVLPEKFMADIGDTVKIYVMFGHAFEHELFKGFKAVGLVYAPNGDVRPLNLKALNETTYVGEVKCEIDGDYVVLINVTAIHEGKPFIDYAKAIIHCGTKEKGWNRVFGLPLEVVFESRPYGLEAPTVVCGYVYENGKPVSGVRVEVEYLNLKKPTRLLSYIERHFVYPDAIITKAVLSGVNGYFCASLDKPGLWVISPIIESEKGTYRSSVIVKALPPIGVFKTAMKAQAVATPIASYAAIAISVIALIIAIVAIVVKRR